MFMKRHFFRKFKQNFRQIIIIIILYYARLISMQDLQLRKFAVMM